MALIFKVLGKRHLTWLTALRNQNKEWFLNTKYVDISDTENWFKESSEKGDLNLIIEDISSDERVGFISLYNMYGGSANIGRMMIDDKFKRQGYMEKAMCKIFDIAKNTLGLDHLVLEVKNENLPARQLYARLGFVTFGFTQNTCIQRKIL